MHVIKYRWEGNAKMAGRHQYWKTRLQEPTDLGLGVPKSLVNPVK